MQALFQLPKCGSQVFPICVRAAQGITKFASFGNFATGRAENQQRLIAVKKTGPLKKGSLTVGEPGRDPGEARSWWWSFQLNRQFRLIAAGDRIYQFAGSPSEPKG
ncbi:hypothetical protein LJR235_002345 [Pararhizobium sp. LjRoot235]|uniref:hypothetical protein n=1 Tax=Pararhizobium sp. LjRoot235 TaxID=3342291 RepID=UPI003ECF3A89